MLPTTRWAAIAAAGALLFAPLSSVAHSAPKPPGGFDFQAEHSALPDTDTRPAVAPSQRQQGVAAGLTIRWNKLGTPATVSKGGAPIATGLAADPEQAARAYLAANRDLYGLTDQALKSLETIGVNPIGKGAAVLLRQRFGKLPAGYDGLVAVGVADGQVLHVTSTLARDATAPEDATLSQQQALDATARDAGMNLLAARTRKVELVAVPTAQRARSAYQVTLVDAAAPAAVTSYVDARTGAVIIRHNLVHYDGDNPRWKVFPVSPTSSTDNRQVWCFKAAPGCDYVAGGDAATGKPWDVDQLTGAATNTSLGNSARTFENRANQLPTSVGTRTNAAKPDRNYLYPWTNQWQTSKCDPATLDSPQEADVEAAMANLFAMHNRMHDWSYRLGFTEKAWNMQMLNGDRGGLPGDPEQGNAQAGARYADVRDNANQITGPDGVAPITNMYLWQPVAGAFYAPCVDGDFDMTVIGHEYTHAISGRMIGGPVNGWSGAQAGAMNESTSDLFSAEQLYENGIRPVGDTPYVTGAYVTGDRHAGIRNYDMSKSPLNYGDVAYDLTGPQVHADGEIWSATQFEVRKAFVGKYGAGSASLQRRCAAGAVPVTKCPGNRRWAQLSFDALLLMASGSVSYVDHRDALLAADSMRFGGADHDIMWNAFARHGLGSGASSSGADDPDPIPSFQSPSAKNGILTLQPGGAAKGGNVRLYVGDYEGRATPIADTDSATPLGATFQIVPGTYDFVAVGAGFGHKRFTATIQPGKRALSVAMSRNEAAAANGAAAAGDGVNQARLIDETEATNWASLSGPVKGRTVTVDLAGDKAVTLRRLQVSAMLRPDIKDPADSGAQNRFTALRQFQVFACNATAGQDCAQDASYKPVYTSPANAFPSRKPRPRAPELIIRSFKIPATTATHLRLQVLSSQCTGNPAYAGEQDNDPRSTTDCTTGSPVAGQVRAAELEAFGS